MNWDDTRIFLALTRAPSLRAAARGLGIDQATVGRRLNALEAELGAKLFLRAKDGYLLTAAGETALAAARRMESAALDLRTKIEGQDDNPGGLVRVTSSDSIAIEFLLPAVERLQQRWPTIRVDLEISTQVLSLTRRQADIAFRNVRPESPDLVVRRVAAWPVGLFASAAYLARFGEPVPDDELRGHQLVAYRPYLDQSPFPTVVEVPARQARIAMAVNSSLLLRKAVAAGIGLGEMPVHLGEREGLVRVWPQRRRASDHEVWQVMHPDLQRTARVRATAEFLSEAFGGS
ncbi:LysR family transcriptional regulator [Acidovorax sp. Leaf76]|uniref:LysR family transcriptional regulator n=1 Tax=unclassified Acidovorax TaxID=2684926 RepID=UPI0006FDA4D1|nr:MULTISPECIES: LysR family transcriptional regulator [unclassified Acidovorax]KQO15260.1 LysR family transcriptional regulator [Acidovorax sp. Leaf76]KQO32076.1 LysR family transcriptional regulator [Acidovorax sp. Leaf84]KQS29573.1 LysR family transcriptional regulator [Acidovorax sp. Leaf191]